MNKTLEALANALDHLGEKVLASWSDDRTLREVHGWHHPAVDRHDLAQIALDLADRIRTADLAELSEDILFVCSVGRSYILGRRAS